MTDALLLSTSANSPMGNEFTSMNPLDVVVVTYQSENHLASCLGSLPEWARVTVVDNASWDSSADLAERLGATVIRNPDNRGFASAVNQAVSQTASKIVLLLNPDAVVDEANLLTLLAAFKNSNVAVAGTRLITPAGEEQRPWWPFPSPSRQWLAVLSAERLVDAVNRSNAGFVVGACFAVRKSVFEELNGFDEDFWLYGEEADFCKRAGDIGYEVKLISEASANHIGGASSKGRESKTFEHFVRGGERFVLKHHGEIGLVSYRIASVLRHGVRALVRKGEERTLHRNFVSRYVAALSLHPRSIEPISAGRGKQLVVVSLEAWDEVWRRNQFLVRELLILDPNLRILWVEPAHDVLHSLIFRRQFSKGAAGSVRSIDGMPSVKRYQPIKWLPRLVGSSVDRSIARQVKRAAAEIEFDSPTLWLNDLALADLTTITAWPTLYDITDDWLTAMGSVRQLKRLAEQEHLVMGRAAEVVVCSPELERRRSKVRPVTLVPNAVDLDHFRTPQNRPIDLPLRPVAVYVGTVQGERVDVELVRSLALNVPALSVVLVGPTHLAPKEIERLQLPNISLLGTRPYSIVPAYLQHADVIIIPHVVSVFTESLDPIKAYEVAAVGRPTVATRVAGFRELGAPVVLADAEDFSAIVLQQLGAGSETVNLEVPSWADRANLFSGLLRQAALPKMPLSAQRAGKKTKVVYVGHCAQRSGAELALLRLLPSMTNTDCHVILAEDGELVPLLREAGISVEVLPMAEGIRDLKKHSVSLSGLPIASVLGTLSYCVRLRKRIKEIAPEIVHTNTLKALVYGTVANAGLQSKLIWHVRDRISPDYLPSFAVRAIRVAARLAPDAVIANSTTTLLTLGSRKSLSSVAPSPVVFDSVLGVETPVEGRESHVGFIVGMVGRLAAWKGQDIFLRAFAEAFPFGAERAVVIGSAMFGEDAFADSLADLVKELKIGERVDFLGFVADVNSELGRLDVLVHASTIPEPFGQVVIEGMAAGLPVIASNAGGPAEVLRNGVDGLLVEPGDVHQLARTLVELRNDPDRRFALGAKARESALEFAPERVAALVEDLYRRVLPLRAEGGR
jgi:glycosyltransferase involved in cell wall biosynthesis